MIIGIDYRFAVTSVRGIGYYIKSVVAALMEIDSNHTYYLYVDEKVDMSLPSNFIIIVIHCKNIVLFEQYYLPIRANKDGVKLLWYPSNSGPIFLNNEIKLVVTVHDLVSLSSRFSPQKCLNFKKFRYALGEKYRGLALQIGLKRINELITVSNYSASQLSQFLRKKAHVIPNHTHPLHKLENSDVFLKGLGLKKKQYMYTIAGTAPHKNLQSYIDLFSDGKIKLPIVISGVFDTGVIEKYQNEYIIFSGFVSENEKATLYSNASAFLFLSLAEGFGLPVIEAMQFNIPIISSDRGALPEVVGEAGLLVSPTDLKHIEQKLLEISAGNFDDRKQQQQFQYLKFANWKIAAKAHLDIFNSYAK